MSSLGAQPAGDYTQEALEGVKTWKARATNAHAAAPPTAHPTAATAHSGWMQLVNIFDFTRPIHARRSEWNGAGHHTDADGGGSGLLIEQFHQVSLGLLYLLCKDRSGGWGTMSPFSGSLALPFSLLIELFLKGPSPSA